MDAATATTIYAWFVFLNVLGTLSLAAMLVLHLGNVTGRVARSDRTGRLLGVLTLSLLTASLILFVVHWVAT